MKPYSKSAVCRRVLGVVIISLLFVACKDNGSSPSASNSGDISTVDFIVVVEGSIQFGPNEVEVESFESISDSVRYIKDRKLSGNVVVQVGKYLDEREGDEFGLAVARAAREAGLTVTKCYQRDGGGFEDREILGL